MSFHQPTWHSPPETLRLGRNDVHVWRGSLDQSAAAVRTLGRILSPDEIDRAEKFHFKRDRDRFITARGLLRTILGRYLHTEPGSLCFCYSPNGKPALALTADAGSLCFNLSHSDGEALYAITYGRRVGIDLEHIREDIDVEQIAGHFFSSREVSMLGALPRCMYRRAFFHCWTRKEAYMKARGEGFSLPSDQFDVSLVPGEPARLLSVKNNPEETSRWSLRELTTGVGQAAAIAVEGYDWQLECWQWTGESPVL